MKRRKNIPRSKRSDVRSSLWYPPSLSVVRRQKLAIWNCENTVHWKTISVQVGLDEVKKKLDVDVSYLVMREASVDLLQPFVLGCDTKQVKIVQLCLTSIQKLLQHHIVNQVRFDFYVFSSKSFSNLGICSNHCQCSECSVWITNRRVENLADSPSVSEHHFSRCAQHTGNGKGVVCSQWWSYLTSFHF